jgi:hypothetical protein
VPVPKKARCCGINGRSVRSHVPRSRQVAELRIALTNLGILIALSSVDRLYAYNGNKVKPIGPFIGKSIYFFLRVSL